MKKMIKVTTVYNGSDVYVNVNKIISVHENLQSEGSSIIKFGGGDEEYIAVQESVEQLIKIIEK